MMWGYGFSWGGMLLILLSMAVCIALLVVLVWAGIRWFKKKTSLPGLRDTGFPTSGPTAMEILRQRYARGEIDATTFEQMHERLEAVSSRETQSKDSVR